MQRVEEMAHRLAELDDSEELQSDMSEAESFGPAAAGAAMASASDSDEDIPHYVYPYSVEAVLEWTAPDRRKKAARLGRPSVGGPSGVDEVAAGPAEPPRGQEHGAEWEAQLARLAAYKVAHGDCNVPARWAEDPRLGSWVGTQRKCKRKLDRGEPGEGMTAARAARLTALGLVWDPDMAIWEMQLARLAAYKAAHGDCNVPKRWAEDLRLGSWIGMQRQRKRKLDRGEPGEGMTVERAARLTAVGLVWEPDMAIWEVQLARLAASKVAHGDCNVPQRWAEDSRLATWVNKQRQLKRKLDRGEPGEGMSAERAAQLTAVGLVWDPNTGDIIKEAEWEVQLARLAAYKVAHGDCNVPKGWAEDPRLGRWVSTQRRGKKNLDRSERSEGMTVARAARLTALGFEWSPSIGGGGRNEAAWEVQLVRLAAYKAARGDCSVPKRWAEDPRLGNWVNMQRQLKRKLDRGDPCGGMTAERVARLTLFGLVW
jgi:hypothetical protein